jgi:hypothetical protein
LLLVGLGRFMGMKNSTFNFAIDVQLLSDNTVILDIKLSISEIIYHARLSRRNRKL